MKSFRMHWKKYLSISLRLIAGLGLLLLAIFLLSEKITLSTSDLGRHLQNGRLVFSQPQLLYTNFYSYTEPDHPFLNSHWLSGVIFYGVFLLGSWKGISMFGLGLQLAAYAISFWLATKRNSFWLAAVWMVPVLLLANERTEVRPELFTNVLLILYVALLWQWKKTKKNKLLWWLIPLQWLWINLHVYAFLGLAVMGVFLFDDLIRWIRESGRKTIRHRMISLGQWASASPLATIFLLSGLVSVINPQGIKGVLFPLSILNTYGYEIAENKSVFFMHALQVNFAIDIFLWLLICGVLLLIITFIFDRRWEITEWLIVLLFGIFGMLMLRNITMFGLLALPILSVSSRVILEKLRTWNPQLFNKIDFLIPQGLIIGSIVGVLILTMSGRYFDRQGTMHQFGFGLSPSAESLGQFLQMHRPPGPIFNNYDIGSYLDWYLFPSQKVFVDNRPEAFSVDFFERYRRMQTDEEVWKNGLEAYDFQTIVFAHTDGTPWAQTFLQHRLRDDQWQVVYLDAYAVVLVHRTDENRLYIASAVSANEENFSKKMQALFEQSQLKQRLYLVSLAGLAGESDLYRNLADQLIRQSPDNFSCWVARAGAYGASDNDDDLKIAQKSLEQAIDLGAELASVHNQLGVVQARRSDLMGARRSWEHALALDHDNQTSLHYLSQLR